MGNFNWQIDGNSDNQSLLEIQSYNINTIKPTYLGTCIDNLYKSAGPDDITHTDTSNNLFFQHTITGSHFQSSCFCPKEI